MHRAPHLCRQLGDEKQKWRQSDRQTADFVPRTTLGQKYFPHQCDQRPWWFCVANTRAGRRDRPCHCPLRRIFATNYLTHHRGGGGGGCGGDTLGRKVVLVRARTGVVRAAPCAATRCSCSSSHAPPVIFGRLLASKRLGVNGDVNEPLAISRAQRKAVWKWSPPQLFEKQAPATAAAAADPFSSSPADRSTLCCLGISQVPRLTRATYPSNQRAFRASPLVCKKGR